MIGRSEYVAMEGDGTNSRDNAFLVRSLMWAQQDADSVMDFGELSQLINEEMFPSTVTKFKTLSSEGSDTLFQLSRARECTFRDWRDHMPH